MTLAERIRNRFEVLYNIQYKKNVYWEKGGVEKTWKSFIYAIIIINFLFLIILGPILLPTVMGDWGSWPLSQSRPPCPDVLSDLELFCCVMSLSWPCYTWIITADLPPQSSSTLCPPTRDHRCVCIDWFLHCISVSAGWELNVDILHKVELSNLVYLFLDILLAPWFHICFTFCHV